MLLNKEDIKRKIEELKPEMLNAISESVSIKSVLDEEDCSPIYPFGKDIDDCLRNTLELCERLGMRTYYGNGYYGYAEVGSGEEMLGILGHLDVVPAGDLEAWNYAPFKMTVVGNRLYGRGMQDDKAPTISSIYALKALMDLGYEPNKRVRFIFGVDEENLWRCMNKYKEDNQETPTYGFTPDSSFCVTNAEKGLLQCILKSNNSSEVNVKGGDAFNSVPSKILYNDIKIEELKMALNKYDFEYVENEDGVTVIGKSVHSQSAHEGINAISRLLIALNEIGINSDVVKFVGEVVKEDANGNFLLEDCYDEVSGLLTFNIGKVDICENGESLSLDIRIPVTQSKEQIVELLKEVASKYNLEYEEFDYLKSIYIPQEHSLIKTLRKVYEEETGLDSTPQSSGGATYARAMDNCVAFGPIFPHSEKTEHEANEYTTIEDLMKSTEIYALAIYELTK